ncbi:MAG: hypothetical protein JWM11_4677 [Planctomycetaceae bacterium]|nr:hypothetical protein [Planctomycetaceae bacterium]
MNETQRRFLRRLRDSQSSGIPQSAIPKNCTEVLAALQTCGAVEFKRPTSRRGLVLCVRSEEAFNKFVGARLPQGLDVDISAVSDRATSVVMLADAKAVRKGIGQGILVRSIKPGIEIYSTDDEDRIHVSDLTNQAGVAAIQLSNERTWGFAGDIVVVENEDAFWRYDVVLPKADLAIFGSGNSSARLLQWLASPAMAQCRITHWGDYDPVGVCQYLRLVDACSDRVTSFAPPTIDELLPKFGKRELVTHQSQFLNRLRAHPSNSYVRRMVDLFDRHRRGLEQEILLCWHAAGGQLVESKTEDSLP